MREFTDNDLDLLARNEYVLSVSRTKIRYTDEFKDLFIEKYKEGKKPADIFRDAGFDVKLIGNKRVERAAARWRQRSGVEVNKENDN